MKQEIVKLVWVCPEGHTDHFVRGDAFRYYDTIKKICKQCGREMRLR
jgi:uncharacterized protein (DUF983 family)